MLYLAPFLLFGSLSLGTPTLPAQEPLVPANPCARAASAARSAERDRAYADREFALVRALNVTEYTQRVSLIAEANLALQDALETADERFQARLEVCARTGGEAYDPVIDPARFVRGVDHPLMPLVVGRRMTYEKQTQTGVETLVLHTTGETRTIMGVECMVVRDTVHHDGVLLEDTWDYFAQDSAGNVWYFGELTMNYVDGRIRDTEGSWVAGEGGAKPGIVMPAQPRVGATYRQEFLPGVAEDVSTILALDVNAATPYGEFSGCLRSFDRTPLDPTEFEIKIFGPGFGIIIEIDLETGETLQLVSVEG